MMPLTLVDVDEDNIIKKIGGKPEVKKHLENLGFVVGGHVKIISKLGGNVIVNVKETRVAISNELAQKIYDLIKGRYSENENTLSRQQSAIL
mgnify:CR=1 FL=1